MATHELKCDPKPFEDVASGRKWAEVRQNDRNYQVGDILHLRETKFAAAVYRELGGTKVDYTGRECKRVVTHVQENYGLPSGLVVLSIRALESASQPGSGEAWQPIETAPRDGTEIILAKGERVTEGLWVGDRWPTASEYHGTTGEYLGQYETGECIEAHWMSFDGGFSEEDQPSHWMPLPAAPSAGNGEAKGAREES